MATEALSAIAATQPKIDFVSRRIAEPHGAELRAQHPGNRRCKPCIRVFPAVGRSERRLKPFALGFDMTGK